MKSDDYDRRWRVSRTRDLTLAYPWMDEGWVEGGYPEAELGQPDAAVSPSGLPVLDDVNALREYLRGIMPDGRDVVPAPPEKGPFNRSLALARLLQGSG